MPQQTKTFRVFISSTFTDMRQERGILQRDAFPRLEKFCEERGARFQAVDLRWGVAEESALNQQTLRICFNEIERCQKISPKPNFLILLGDKYGWQPIPEIVPGSEMKVILEILKGDDKKLIEKWYWLDNNAVPPEYVLQPMERLKQNEGETNDELKEREYNNWKLIEDALRTVLRNAVNEAGSKIAEEQKNKYFCSATHQEILRGALNPKNQGKNPEEHVYVFSRTLNGLPNDLSAKDYIDLLGNVRDEASKASIEKLKDELQGKIGQDHFITYQGDWKSGNIEFEEGVLQTFSDDIYEKLKDIIQDQLERTIEKDEVELEVKLHTEFKERLTEHFKGRTDILEKIGSYLNNRNEKRVMSMIGESGSGKSSVMAQAVKLAEVDHPSVVYRFIGATTSSSNIMSLLQNLTTQVAKSYGIEAKSLAREGDEKAWYDINGLADIFRKCLGMATEEKPVIIFLDSLDQLSDTDNAKALYWLPRELPDHARIVVSSLPELLDKLIATTIEKLDVLPEKDAIDILDKWFSSIHRKLTTEQHSLVINSFNKTKLPIYLKLAFEKAKYWHSYDKEHSIKEDVSGIINDYFDDLEHDFPEDFVKNAVCYMLSGRYQGLAENEILEILALDPEYWETFKKSSHKDHRQELQDLKDFLEKPRNGQRGYMKIPIAVWSRLYLDLEPFLTERDADGVPIITFFHRQFNEVLRERYKLLDPNFKN